MEERFVPNRKAIPLEPRTNIDKRAGRNKSNICRNRQPRVTI